MKNINKITLLIFSLWAVVINAQPVPNNTEDCDHTATGPFISTAPATMPSPWTSTSFQTNTWDWTQEHLPCTITPYVAASNGNNNPLPAGLQNPFFSTAPYLTKLAKFANSDFYPADGWELIKRDFGTLYDGSQNSNAAPAPYFILYNKYSGKLRILSSAYGLGLHQVVNIDLRFIDLGQDISQGGALNLTNYKQSGLFTYYNNPPLALDQNSAPVGTIYSTPAVFPSDDFSFFYGDFQLAYDPCTCVFQSGLEVNFTILDTLTVNLSGNILGSVIPITDNAAQITLDPSHNWLSSVTQSNNSVNGGLQIYDNIKNMESDFIAIQQNYDNQQAVAQGLGSALGSISSVFSAAGQIVNGFSVAGATPTSAPQGWTGTLEQYQTAYANSLATNGQLGGYLQGIGTNVSFLGAQVQQYSSPNGGPPTEPFVLYAQTQLSGRIAESTEVAAQSFNIGMPGSAGSPSLPEVTGSSPYNVPPYPEYNEVLGVFALLKTPHLIRYDWVDTIVTPVETLYNPGHAYQLQSPSEIQYAFNPAAHPLLGNIVIQAAWEDEWSDSAITSTIPSAAYNGQYFNNPSGNLIPVNFYNGLIDEISPFMDLEHFQNLCINPASLGQYPSSSGQPDPNLTVLSSDNIFIKFNIIFTSSDPGRNGFLNTSMFTVRYNIPSANIVNQNVAGRTAVHNGIIPGVLPPLSFSPYVTIPLQNYTISSSTTLTSDLTGYYNIYINAPITNTSSTPINIIAANSIVVGDGGSVGPNINLIILSDLGIPSGSPIPPLSNNDVSTFCSSNNYLANQPTQMLRIPDTTQNGTAISNTFKINLYPNPSNGECTVRFTESSGANVTITLVDIMGRDVATIDQSWHNQGTSFVPFSTESYAPGVYTVRFSDGTHTSTQRLTITGK